MKSIEVKHKDVVADLMIQEQELNDEAEHLNHLHYHSDDTYQRDVQITPNNRNAKVKV